MYSSNGIFVNGEEKPSMQLINLRENDLVGIGCPETDIELNSDTLYVYRVRIIQSPVLQEEEEEERSTLSKTINLNNNTPREGTSARPANCSSRKRYERNSNYDKMVPNKKAHVTYNDERNANASSSKGINCNSSRNNQTSHNSRSINNLENECDIIDITADDDIVIIHTSIIKEVKENLDLKSVKYLDGGNNSDFDEKMDISSIESDSDNGDVNDRENPNFTHTDDQMIKCENELQLTDDEGAHKAADKHGTAKNKSPIKLKKLKHESKTRFSIIDVVDLSDDEEGIFPCSQLFDIKYEDNTENRTEIKQEYIDNEYDERNTENIGLLNVDDEVIILTDSEDEDNPWLERLSRSQLLNEDIKPAVSDAIIKDEIDLGIWDDEFEQSEIPYTSKASCSKEIPSLRPSVIVETKKNKDDYSTKLPTEVDAMDVDQASLNDSSTRDIDRSCERHIIDSNIRDRKKHKTDAKQNVQLDKRTESVKQKLSIPTKKMDVDQANLSNESSTRGTDESRRNTDINRDRKKQKRDAKQDVQLDKRTPESAKQKLTTPIKQVDAMDVDQPSHSNDSSTRDIDERQIIDSNIHDRKKQKRDAKQNIQLDKRTPESAKQKLTTPIKQVDAMDVDQASLSNDSSTRDISEKQNIDSIIRDRNKQKKDVKQDIQDKRTTESVKQKLITSTKKVDEMEDEAGPFNDSSTRGIDEDKQIIDDKNKQKTNAKQGTKLDKQAFETIKQKLIAKSTRKLIPVIEPLSLPSRRRRSDYGKDRATKVREDSSSKSSEKISKLKEKLNDNFYNKEKDRKEKSKSTADSFSASETRPGPSISKDEKKKIIEQRKMKLKEIAAEEKKLTAESDQSIKRRNKPRAKISLKNRGDFLVPEEEPQVSKSLPDKSVKLPKSSDDRSKKRSTDKANTVEKSATKVSLKNRGDFLVPEEEPQVSKSLPDKSVKLPKSSDDRSKKRSTGKADMVEKSATFDAKKSRQKTDVSKDTVNNIATSLQQSLHLDNMSTSEVSTLDFKATNHNRKKRSGSKDNIKRSDVNADPNVSFQDRSTEHSSAMQKENFSPNSLKSSLVKLSPKSKKKKRVTFSDPSLVQIREYEIDQRNNLNKLTWKDAPIPTNKLVKGTRASIVHGDFRPKLEEFLLRIFMWNPVWLEEQRYLKRNPPIVLDKEVQTMRLSYDSYKQYYEIAMPLLLLEIWCILTKDFEMIQNNKQRPTIMCSVAENSVTCTPIPSTNLFLTTLMLEILVSKDDMYKQIHPIYGDLVYLEYVTIERGKKTFHKIFAYVTNMQRMIITDFTHYNRDLRNYVKNPYAVITFTLLTRPLEHNIPVNQVQRVRTVTYLRSNIRMMQALQYLPHSPLLKLIVNPKIENYQLVPLNEQFMSSSLVTKDNLNPKQLEAVFKVTDAVVKKEAKLCFIQGPPGTGKSKVIVNLVSQILYGERPDKKSLRILVCAPSNAAIDEIVLRLLNIRSKLKLKMVRIGRIESMHSKTKTISVPELAKRFLGQMTQKATNGNYVNYEDMSILQARINAYKSELENAQKMNEEKRLSLVNQLDEMFLKYELLASGKSIDELNPKDRAKYQRMAENIVLMGANIIACTLSSCYTNQMESLFGGHKDRISVCIVDEATQSCEAETLIPLMLGVNTLVLVGDPNQLPATILSQRAKRKGLDQSLFSRVQNTFASQSNNPIIMLDTQYRMEDAISYWPNKYFYGGKLKNAIDCRTKFPFHPYRILYHNFTQNDDKFSNTTEAEFVANIIFTMLMFGKWESSIDTLSLGVLTPYNNQRTLVLNKINEKISIVPDSIRKKIIIEVNTVDGFQGQERDIIIMSCVRSSGIGFLSDKQRLCVALTRAKHSLILCGNFNTFMRDHMWKALLTDAQTRKVLCNIDANASPSTIKKYIVK
ncbi:PREDICTED: probable helicase senataxin isoform X2 [Wasmannia auropunctata]|uniref:probable helicase senataxin isoform X2 n=1 Tax=Wasmannia auropunctata TaxID=64793 RepID=UPI0005EFFA0C|nr:PREDICTED: probable helicase senataxin isoform X2 [Wasmannia auropunctata]